MKILMVGNGGREHALLWKLRRDAPEAEFFITRGNGGTDRLATALPFAPGEFQSLAGWAEQQSIDLTVVGPEGPLAAGITDHFAARGLPVFGPIRGAAEIESSKAFAKTLMKRHGIPTARFELFRELGPAERFARQMGAPLVVKASGLAGGKGAVVCGSVEEAVQALREILGGAFGDAGQEVVIEEFMEGEELSVFALCDGTNAVPMLPAQDHKRMGEGETGPNTGGMGAYAPVSPATPALLARVQRDVLLPTLAALREAGRPFRGLLYAGLMIEPDGAPRVVEFNCRFGDPETQALLPLLDGELLDPMLTIARGGAVEGLELRWKPGASVTTVLAAGGYPGDYSTGVPVEIPAEIEHDGVLVFHAGTERREGRLVTAGGRVLAVTAIAATVREAASRSRSAAEQIRFEGRHFRRDIGWREVERGA